MWIQGSCRNTIGIHRQPPRNRVGPVKSESYPRFTTTKEQKGCDKLPGEPQLHHRFIAQSTVICEPIFKMLRKDAETRWTEDCQKAFGKIKEYLSTPPVIVPPKPRRPLLLYLFVIDRAFSFVLGQHNGTGRKEQAIYYLSKNFTP
ncbi:uncharacterized protein [Nicotiana sylvestris]|uniref:uncharacterized protein n=1 Tax=Nicotiana sylvestris TaxID=4096 RepID=UPI00388C479E